MLLQKQLEEQQLQQATLLQNMMQPQMQVGQAGLLTNQAHSLVWFYMFIVKSVVTITDTLMANEIVQKFKKKNQLLHYILVWKFSLARFIGFYLALVLFSILFYSNMFSRTLHRTVIFDVIVHVVHCYMQLGQSNMLGMMNTGGSSTVPSLLASSAVAPSLRNSRGKKLN